MTADEASGAGITAVEQVPLEVPAECVSHFGERPVGDADDLESAGEAVGQALAHEQWRRAEEHDPQREAGGGVLVPQLLHEVRPAMHLLDLVEHQQAAGAAAIAGCLAADRPLGLDPCRVLEVRRVRRRQVAGHPDGVHHLARQRGLPHLPRPGKDLDEAPGLVGARQHLLEHRAAEAHLRQVTHTSEWNYSVARVMVRNPDAFVGWSGASRGRCSPSAGYDALER